MSSGSLVKKDDPKVAEIVEVSIGLAELMCSLATTERREATGGSFALYDQYGNQIHVWTAGVCDEEDFKRYIQNAINKCLAMHRADVVCSGMVADETADPPIYDGGIQLENGWFLAFSGFPAEYDRVLCIMVAVEVELLTLPGRRLNTIMQFGPNRAIVGVVLHSFMMLTLYSSSLGDLSEE